MLFNFYTMKRIFVFFSIIIINSCIPPKAQTTYDDIKKENEYLKKCLK